MQRRLLKVKTKRAIHAHRRTFELLDGEYASFHHGRSHDFDDLREYTPGDEVKDIDWKATARSNVPLVKRYIASRQHNVVMVVDTGRGMAAMAEGGERKADIALGIVGVLSYLAVKHGDRVAMYAGNRDQVGFTPEGGSEAHLERMLRILDEQIRVDAPPSDLQHVLAEVVGRVRRRSIVVIVADDVAYGHELDTVLGRLQVQHEVLWVSVGDADLMARSLHAPRLWGVDGDIPLLEYFRRDTSLARDYDEGTRQRQQFREHELRAIGISSVRVSATGEMIAKLFSLLERHRRARR